MSSDIRILNPRRCGNREYRRRILILTEGQTEEYYFKKFFVKKNSPVRVIPVHVTDHNARNVPDVCGSMANAYSIDTLSGDRLIFVLDTDANDEKDIMAADRALSEKGYELYLSNPSFEYWLVLHFIDVKKYVTQDDLEDTLSGSKCFRCKYVKGSEASRHIDENTIDDAVKRAESNENSVDNEKCVRNNPGTTLHKLIRELRSMQ